MKSKLFRLIAAAAFAGGLALPGSAQTTKKKRNADGRVDLASEMPADARKLKEQILAALGPYYTP